MNYINVGRSGSMNLYDDLRALYPVFNYDGYKIEDDGIGYKITYFFEILGLEKFNPTWYFEKNGFEFSDNATFENAVFNLGMVELVSYWKLTCSPTVNVKCGYLSDEQIKWWKKLYFNGLGECFYLNKITDTMDNFMNIFPENKKSFEYEKITLSDGCIIPVGGGKDSVVTLSILKKLKDKSYCYIINPRGATTDTAKVSGFENRTIAARRTLDKNMLRLNSEGFINGHTPFSAIVAFSSIIAGIINGVKYVALSNESSANESTVSDSYVNHQYSKSFEFEYDFHIYEEKYIKSGVYYFSLLRPLSEYQIAKLFAKQKQFYSIFKSCNTGSKQNIWCGNCPKCLFVFIILSPFMTDTELSEIFGSNLLDKQNLLDTFKKLVGILPEKPFECVGSREEINFALKNAVKMYDGKDLPYLLKYYTDTELYKKYKDIENPFDSYYDKNNLLPEKFEKLLKDALYTEE